MKLFLEKVAIIVVFAACAAIPVRSAATGLPPASAAQDEKISVQGIVTDAKGRPVSGAKVEFEDENGKLVTARTDRNGAFAIDGLIERAVYIVYAKGERSLSSTEARSFIRGDKITIRME